MIVIVTYEVLKEGKVLSSTVEIPNGLMPLEICFLAKKEIVKNKNIKYEHIIGHSFKF